jgi:ribulose-phosphate 3-epimerase
MKISPSILDADFEALQSEVNSIASADRIHLDIMDGKYVPRETFRASDLAHVEFPLPIEAHLMVNDPKSFFDEFENLGVIGITFHIETQEEEATLKLFEDLKTRGLKAGICIDGYTGDEALSDEVLKNVDKILVMSVKAGKGGQSFMTESLDKIKAIRRRGFKGEIEVDGGVTLLNVGELKEAGADIVVVGSFLMKKGPTERQAIIREFQEV